MAPSLRSVIPVWIAALVGALAVWLFAPVGQAAFVWIPVVLAAVILLTFTIQLSLARKEGLVERIIASLAGALVVLVAASGVLALRAASTVTASDSCACVTVADAG